MRYILLALISVVIGIGGLFFPQQNNTLTPQMQVAMQSYLNASQNASFGNTQPIAGQTYNLSGAGISSSATTIPLTSLTLKQTGQPILTADLVGSGGTFYVTLDPGSNTRQEIVGCTGVSQSGTAASLTGCTRGLAPLYPYSASTTLQFSHSGGSQVIFSDPPQLFNLYAAKGNNEWVTGTWGFAALPTTTVTCSTQFQLCNKAYIDGLVVAGGVAAGYTVPGIGFIATGLQMASSTASTTYNAVVYPNFLSAQNATSTSTGVFSALKSVITNNAGKLDLSFFDLTKWYNFSQLFSTNATTTNATTTSQYITGILSSLLKTDSTGQVKAAVAGTDYSKASYSMASTTGWTTSVVATSTVVVFIPANTLTASSSIQFDIQNSCQDAGSTGAATSCTWALRNALGTSFTSFGISPADNTTATGWVQGKIVNDGSVASQKGAFEQFTTTQAGVTSASIATITSTINFAVDQTLYLVMTAISGTGPNIATIPAYTITVLP